MRIVGEKTERKTNISLLPADIHTYKLTFVSFFSVFFAPSPNAHFESNYADVTRITLPFLSTIQF